MPRKCGTPSGEKGHYERGEKPCAACRQASRQYGKEFRLRKAGLRERIRPADVIVDVLITQDRWLRTDLLVDLVLELHPEWKERAVSQALYRLEKSRVVEARLVEFVYTDGRTRRKIREFRADDEAWEQVSA